MSLEKDPEKLEQKEPVTLTDAGGVPISVDDLTPTARRLVDIIEHIHLNGIEEALSHEVARLNDVEPPKIPIVNVDLR